MAADNLLEHGIPNSQDIERMVLGACLARPDPAVEVLQSLTTEDFFLDRHKIIFNAMKKLSEIGSGIDRITIYECLMTSGQEETIGGFSYLSTLDEGIPEILNLKDYIKILKGKTALRTMIAIGKAAVELALDPTTEPDSLYQDISSRLYTEFQPHQKSRLMMMQEFVDSYPGGINVLLQPSRKSEGLLSGFDKFDEMTDGFHESEIFMVGGAPSAGKSTWMSNVAVNVAKRGSMVVIFSLEMSRDALFYRIVCNRAEISVNRFRRGDMNLDERLRLAQATDFVRKLPLAIDPTSGLRVPDMAMKLKQIHQKTPVSLAAIDFIQLMKSASSRQSENDKLTEIAQGIQELAKTTGIPFLILSQLNRPEKAAKDKRPSLASLRGSGSLEQVSNVVAFIYSEEQRPEDASKPKGATEFIVAKNREGETGTVNNRFVKWKGQFEEV